MNIKVLEKDTKEIKDFDLKEWSIANQDHFNQVFDWKVTRFVLEANENEEIVGTLHLKITVDVALIEALIVSTDKRSKGIGKQLIQKAEEILKKEKVHKIYLQTGKNWDAANFYKSLGYQITGELPNHIHHQDFVEFTKFI